MTPAQWLGWARGVLAQCTHPNTHWLLYYEEQWAGHPILQLKIDTLCTKTGEPSTQKSRKWILSRHMTKSELVQTALKATLTAMEHEVRENFLYRGQRVFGPHFNVDSLVDLASLPQSEDRRRPVDEPPTWPNGY